MKSAKEIFNIRFFVRLACILLIIALAIFLYFYGKQRTVYIDNWSAEINGTRYSAEDWALVSVDGGETTEFAPRMRIGVPLRGRTHTIKVTYDDRSYNEIELPEVEFTVEYDTSLLSIPALVAGVPVEDCISEFIIQPAPEPAAEDPAAGTDDMMDAGFGDMSMEI